MILMAGTSPSTRLSLAEVVAAEVIVKEVDTTAAVVMAVVVIVVAVVMVMVVTVTVGPGTRTVVVVMEIGGIRCSILNCGFEFIYMNGVCVWF